jgi:hypothetical protein
MSGRVCFLGGWLVKAETRLPLDPSEVLPRQPEVFGCNRLRCESCGAWVRSGAPHLGLRGKRDLADFDVARALHATVDWETLPFVERSAGTRLYACRCCFFEVFEDSPVGGEKDSPNDPYVSWWCAGHPGAGGRTD